MRKHFVGVLEWRSWHAEFHFEVLQGDLEGLEHRSVRTGVLEDHIDFTKTRND